MKKSELRQIIRELIKEQVHRGPGNAPEIYNIKVQICHSEAPVVDIGGYYNFSNAIILDSYCANNSCLSSTFSQYQVTPQIGMLLYSPTQGLGTPQNQYGVFNLWKVISFERIITPWPSAAELAFHYTGPMRCNPSTNNRLR